MEDITQLRAIYHAVDTFGKHLDTYISSGKIAKQILEEDSKE